MTREQDKASGEEQAKTRGLEARRRQRHRLLVEALFLLVIIMALTGFALSNAAPQTGYHYWLFTLLAFAAIAIITGNIHAWEQHRSLWRITAEQLVHWGITLLSVLVVHLVLLSGRLTYEAAGLMVMLLLGQALALDGYHRAGWRFGLLGLVMMGLTLLAGWMAASIWLLALGGILLWALSFPLEALLHSRKKRAALPPSRESR